MPDLSVPSNRRDQFLYLGVVLALTFLCLWTVWALEFPPLQDYPQHLFLAHVNATYADSAYNWPHYYLANLKFGPYTFFYLLVAGLDGIVSITTAGKLYLSLYVCSLSALAIVLGKNRQLPNPPWGSLLLFPLAFHQMYFMGFTNFLLSVPILAFAILDHQRLSCEGPSLLAFSRQALLLFLLLLCHPYTILVYICLALACALLAAGIATRRKAALVPPLVTACFFVGWYFTALPSNQGRMPLLWWPWQETLKYYCLMFTGMRWSSGMNWQVLLAWIAAFAIVLRGAVCSMRAGALFPRQGVLAFVLTTTGFLVLPFWAGQYSYFNLRMAPISYLFAAILAGYCTLSRTMGLGLAAIAALLIVQSTTLQAAISKETAEIAPILTEMEPNAAILPMTFQTESAILDRHFFPEAHSHDYFYYHLLVGGGASPYLFPSPMLPVLLKAGVDLPKATHDFSWQEHGSRYDYILTRGAPAEFTPFVKRYAPLVGQSGEWLLFKNEHKK
ncbi:MAG: hypothetical protein PHI06_03715 [Desulfobulbaceae bacterium]|nr:hypothetical protein [Desulfobulbaceae bacterium]